MAALTFIAENSQTHIKQGFRGEFGTAKMHALGRQDVSLVPLRALPHIHPQ